MNSKNLPVVLGVTGLAVAWWYAKRQTAQLNAILSALPANPAPLTSRQIGDGYLDPITGGTGMAPIVVDRHSGDMTTPYGTDLILGAVDPFDPSIPYLPDVQPQNIDLINQARSEM